VKLVVMSDPKPGRDDEYNDWYTNVHLPAMMEIPGVSGAERLVQAVAAERGTPPGPRYLAIYDFDGDAAELMTELNKRSGAPNMRSDALDSTGSIVGMYDSIVMLP
jgi:hypothetical protein